MLITDTRRYSLKRLASKNFEKGQTVELPTIQESLSTYLSYKNLLDTQLIELSNVVRDTILVSYRPYAITSDSESWFSATNAKIRQIVRDVTGSLAPLFKADASRHTADFIENARRSLGVDLQQVIDEEDLTTYLRDAVSRNTDLIKNLTSQIRNDIGQQVYNAKINGLSTQALADNLAARFGVSNSRAKLIARDQINKLNSDMTRIRQQQAGIDDYKWQTSEDERVRPLHQSIDQTVYEWGEPTGAEDGLPPGQPINCRCTAIAVIKF